MVFNPADWICGVCRSINMSNVDRCYSCRAAKGDHPPTAHIAAAEAVHNPATSRASSSPRDVPPTAQLPSDWKFVTWALALSLVVLLGSIKAIDLANSQPNPTAAAVMDPSAAAGSSPTELAPPTTQTVAVPPTPTAAPVITPAPTPVPTPKPTPLPTAEVVRSSNWAGYGFVGAQFTSVSAEWTQPEVDCANALTARVSIWVGLDGHGSTTVEQIGTAAACGRYGISPDYYAWWEMYPSPLVRIGLEIHAGDHVRASVTELSPGTFGLELRNTTTGQSFAKQASRFGGPPVSAEWIVEPTGICDPDCTTPALAKFTKFRFSKLVAHTSTGPVDLSGTGDARPIRFALLSDGHDKLATTSALDTDKGSFGVSWVKPAGWPISYLPDPIAANREGNCEKVGSDQLPKGVLAGHRCVSDEGDLLGRVTASYYQFETDDALVAYWQRQLVDNQIQPDDSQPWFGQGEDWVGLNDEFPLTASYAYYLTKGPGHTALGAIDWMVPGLNLFATFVAEGGQSFDLSWHTGTYMLWGTSAL